MTPSEKLKRFLSNQNPTESPIKNEKLSISDEFRMYKRTGQKTKRLRLLEKALMNLKPSSVESERIFSSVGRIATKYRMRLNDDNLNALVVLRAYYLNEIRNKL